jgi:putative nucleotidyltransferase with HDIG domain
MEYLLHSSYPKVKETDKILESLEEDIEEKNRQLLVLIENLNLEHAKTKEAFLGIIASLAKALEARDPYTEGHSQRVTNYALIMADKLGWQDELKEKLNSAALLHDLGKIGIPDSILHKKGLLTDEEYDFIKKHEVISIKILEPLKEIKDILPWIMHHHEKWDGSGYPHGLGGNSIPLGAQIIALADTFDAITTGRDYKKALSVEDALNEIIKFKGSQFNPQLVDIFVEAMRANHPQK